MLTVDRASGAKEGYYSSLAKSQEDYYVGSKTQPAGIWVGKGAEQLKLGGQAVDPEVFRNLFRGYSPDGEKKWVQNAGRMGDGERDRRPGYDFTFSAPKSASIAIAIGGEELQKGIERIHFEAIKKALESAEEKAFIRKGRGGYVKEEAGLIVAIFQHMTARQVDLQTLPDMQLHSHALIINTGVTKTGGAGAISGEELFFKLIFKEMDATYKAEFAKGLIELGFHLRLTDKGFEIVGISDKAIEYFSKRTAQIDEKVDRQNSTKAERAKVAIETRLPKREFKADEVERFWKSECKEKFGLTEDSVNSLRGGDKRPDNLGAFVASEAAKELASKQTLYSSQELEEKTVERGAPLGLTEKEAKDAAREYIKSKESYAVAFESETGTRLYATREEATSARVVKALEEKRERTGSRELNSVVETAKEQGLRVLVCSVKKIKVELLKEEGIEAYTMAKILSDLERESTSGMKSGRATAKSNFSASSREQLEWLFSTWQISPKEHASLLRDIERAERKIDDRTVVILNEPDGLEQNESFKRFAQLVKQNGGKVVLVDAAKTPEQEIKRRIQETSRITFERKEEKRIEGNAEQEQRQKALSR